MHEYYEVTAEGLPARVIHKSDDELKVYFQQKNGKVGNVTGENALPWKVGDTLLLWPEDNRVELAPAEVLPNPPQFTTDSIAVVRLRLDDITILEFALSDRKIVPTQDSPEYDEGNTVLVSVEDKIVRVLSPKPLRTIDMGSGEKFDVSRFRVDPSNIDESFDDIGGLESIIARAKRLVDVPLLKAEHLKAIGAKPIRGVLFSGPPGSGKTMLARVLAKHSSATFYKIGGPDFLSKWYGESEAILRGVFEDAKKHEPAIIFIDEIDSVAVKRSNDSHEATQRVVAQLLTLMDGFESNKRTVVIAATNRPDSLDPALLRPGRFDWEVAFPQPDASARLSILEKSARRLRIGSKLPLKEAANETDGWSAADLNGIWGEAALLAAEENRNEILTEDFHESFKRARLQRKEREVRQ